MAIGVYERKPKTHCKRGHGLTKENTHIRWSTTYQKMARNCLLCEMASRRARIELYRVPKLPIKERFKNKIQVVENGCHIWLGSKRGQYGIFCVNGKRMRAHRFAFIETHGEIPSGLVVDHMCMNKLCVNPAHLRVVTPRVNTMENSNSDPAIRVAAKLLSGRCVNGHKTKDNIC